jgi:hypothetical protein
MLILVVAALLILAIPLIGGRLRRLGDLRIKDPWLVLVALGVQVVLISFISGGSQTLWKAVHLATYATIAVFVVRNRAIPRLWLVAVGGASNLIAIAANGGVMPASQKALEQSGRAPASGFANSAPLIHAHLTFLGDIIATPRWLPFANVLSVGDVTLVIGLAWLALTISKIPDDQAHSFIRASARCSVAHEDSKVSPDPRPRTLRP